MAEVIDDAIDFLEKIRAEDEVTIKFRKKDGTERIMRCTLNFDRIPDADKPKDVSLKKIMNLIRKFKHIHVYDLDKNGWRTVPFDRAEWMDINNQRYRIKA